MPPRRRSSVLVAPSAGGSTSSTAWRPPCPRRPSPRSTTSRVSVPSRPTRRFTSRPPRSAQAEAHPVGVPGRHGGLHAGRQGYHGDRASPWRWSTPASPTCPTWRGGSCNVTDPLTGATKPLRGLLGRGPVRRFLRARHLHGRDHRRQRRQLRRALEGHGARAPGSSRSRWPAGTAPPTSARSSPPSSGSSRSASSTASGCSTCRSAPTPRSRGRSTRSTTRWSGRGRPASS